MMFREESIQTLMTNINWCLYMWNWDMDQQVERQEEGPKRRFILIL